MERGENERWNKLSDGAKAVAAVLARYVLAGHDSVSLNQLRQHRLGASRDILMWLDELRSRAYGRLDHEDEADPVFTVIAPAFQTLMQAGKIGGV